MFRFEGFTNKANEALNSAVNCAQQMGHTFIGTEHILFGLTKVENSVAAEILQKASVTGELLEKKMAEVIGKGMPTVLDVNDFTARSKRVIQLAVSAAQQWGTNYVGTEHLLAALLQERDNYAVRFLTELGISNETMFSELYEAVNKFETDGEGFDEDESGKSIKGADGKSGKALEKFGRDLTSEAKKGGIDPVIGRQKEIERVIQILSRRTKNNPCLIGEPGVGKTAIAEGIALKIVSGDVPENLKNKRLVSLDLTGMVAGAKYRGDFEERIKSAVDEVKKSKDIILFIDEIHTIVGAGSAEGATDAANILKPSLTGGELQVIGATTVNEYRKYIEKDSALERRFQPVMVGEPSREDSILILKGIRDLYEGHHKVKITDEALEAAVNLSSRYISDRFLPDKAIDLVDEAASRVRLAAITPTDEIKNAERQLESLEREMSEALNAQEFERCAQIRDEQKVLKEKLEKSRDEWSKGNSRELKQVTAKEIASVVSMWTGIPVAQLTEEESARLMRLEETLHKRVVGQEEAVSAVAKAIRRGRAGIKDPKRPIGSFIFLGPTGVGKTELCKALAEAMFGDENSIIRLDMSEYMEKHTVSRLVGSPPGYVGFDEGGQLTEKVRRKPYSVILFDEIEKAHPDVFNILLQILDDGSLTDAQGRRVDFKNTVIIMTSNIGARNILNTASSTLGFTTGEKSGERDFSEIKKVVTDELKKAFRPEFLNRVDDIIVFHRLDSENIKLIAEKMLDILKNRVKQMDIDIKFTDSVVEKIAEHGFDPDYGARPLRRAIMTEIEDRLSESILSGEFKAGDSIICDFKENQFDFCKNS